MPRRGPRYTEQDAREAMAASQSYSEALRRLGMRPAGGNHRQLKRYVEEIWKIPTDHLRPPHLRPRPKGSIPLEEILVEHCTYHRGHLKRRLYASGQKKRCCELCGQGEEWRGSRMSLILDHINGRATDNRLENLRIVCPNCAATLDTHCGRALKRIRTERPCRACKQVFYPSRDDQQFCSHRCYGDSQQGVAQIASRKVERPPYEQLLAELSATSYLAVGRRYGVSDKAIRKWVRQYERERTRDRDAA